MRLIFILLFSCCLRFANAQDSTKTWKYAITWKALGMINPQVQNATAGILWGVNKDFMIEFQAGYIFKSPRFYDYSVTQKINLNGFKSNLEYKLFFYEGLYGGAQLMYQRYVRSTNEYYSRYAMTYQELFEIEKLINTYVGHLKLGQIVPLFEGKVLFDLYAGVGIRYKMVQVINSMPEDAAAMERRGVEFGTNEVGNQIYPSVTAGFSLGYILK
jgi:hypothetical protein